jgi:hypothetical protein
MDKKNIKSSLLPPSLSHPIFTKLWGVLTRLCDWQLFKKASAQENWL